LSSYLKNYSTNFLAVLGLIHHTYRLSIDVFTFGKRWFFVIHICISIKSTLMSGYIRKTIFEIMNNKGNAYEK